MVLRGDALCPCHSCGGGHDVDLPVAGHDRGGGGGGVDRGEMEWGWDS